MLHLFNTRLLAPEEGDPELCKYIKTNILDYLKNKYAALPSSDLLDIASFVDPRFRAKNIQSD